MRRRPHGTQLDGLSQRVASGAIVIMLAAEKRRKETNENIYKKLKRQTWLKCVHKGSCAMRKQKGGVKIG